MSNAWLNIRFGIYHLIIGERSLLSVRLSRNGCHKQNPRRVELHGLRLFGIFIR